MTSLSEKYEGKLITKLRKTYQTCNVFKKLIKQKGSEDIVTHYYGLMRLEMRADACLYIHLFESPGSNWIIIRHDRFLEEINNKTLILIEGL